MANTRFTAFPLSSQTLNVRNEKTKSVLNRARTLVHRTMKRGKRVHRSLTKNRNANESNRTRKVSLLFVCWGEKAAHFASCPRIKNKQNETKKISTRTGQHGNWTVAYRRGIDRRPVRRRRHRAVLARRERRRRHRARRNGAVARQEAVAVVRRQGAVVRVVRRGRAMTDDDDTRTTNKPNHDHHISKQTSNKTKRNERNEEPPRRGGIRGPVGRARTRHRSGGHRRRHRPCTAPHICDAHSFDINRCTAQTSPCYTRLTATSNWTTTTTTTAFNDIRCNDVIALINNVS
jgi:hypothetical protein